MIPSLGRIVHLRLSAGCADSINKRRADAQASRVGEQETGAQVHVGNPVAEGDEYPLIITRVWSDTCISGQVLLDGNDTLWASSVLAGDEPGQWHEPERV